MAILFKKSKKFQVGGALASGATAAENARFIQLKNKDYKELMTNPNYTSTVVRFVDGRAFNKYGNEVPIDQSQYAGNPNKWFASASAGRFDRAALQFPELYGQPVDVPTEGMTWIQPEQYKDVYNQVKNGDLSKITDDTMLGYLKHGTASYPVNYGQYKRLSPIMDALLRESSTWHHAMSPSTKTYPGPKSKP